MGSSVRDSEKYSRKITLQKMRRYIIFGIICSAVFLVTSCGKQHKAESVVKDFLDKNMTTSDYSISFNEIDSTRHLTDSMINVMKSNARKYNLFKKEIAYDISTMISHTCL